MRLRVANVAALALAILLLGCQTTAQTQANEFQARARTLSRNLASCYEPIQSDPQFATLYRRLHLSMGRGEPTLSQRSDQMRPTIEEAGSLEDWHKAEAPCRQIAASGLRSLSSDLT